VADFGCSFTGCERHPQKGDAIFRVNPKGEPFEGRCSDHYDHAFNEDDCDSCASVPGGESEPANECPKSPRACGHHCNHSWSHEQCHWCGKEWGES